MNERIKLLAKQAGTYFGGGTTDHFGDYLPPYVSITDLDLEKFAELIIKECSDLFETEWGEEKLTGNDVGYVLKEHFGVEE
jgi:hypothetical protein